MTTKVNLKSLTKSKKIDSPLAKYNGVGQLFCVLCSTQIKNEMFWTGHVNGKAHKDNLVQLKKSQVGKATNTNKTSSLPSSSSVAGLKRPAPLAPSVSSPQSQDDSVFKEPPSKKRVTFETDESNATSPTPAAKRKLIEAEEELSNMVIEENQQRDKNTVQSTGTRVPDDNGQQSTEEKTEVQAPVQERLPQGFFDDPKEDAKARGIKFKDPQEAEWEKFVKEIATEDLKSNEIVGQEQETSAVDRELEQIEEQMVQWQRVIQLEKKAEELGKLKRNTDERRNPEATDNGERMEEGEDDEQGDELDEDFDEDLDWRNKKKG